MLLEKRLNVLSHRSLVKDLKQKRYVKSIPATKTIVSNQISLPQKKNNLIPLSLSPFSLSSLLSLLCLCSSETETKESEEGGGMVMCVGMGILTWPHLRSVDHLSFWFYNVFWSHRPTLFFFSCQNVSPNPEILNPIKIILQKKRKNFKLKCQGSSPLLVKRWFQHNVRLCPI